MLEKTAWTIENPVIGDRITFLQTTAETNGEYLRLQVELAAGGGNARHYHLDFTEQFEVVDGRLYLDVNGEQLVLEPGQRALVPIGSVHRFYAAADEPVTFVAEIRPARQFERALRISYGLATDGRVDGKGRPVNPLELAVVFKYVGTYLPGVPLWLQKGTMGVLAWLAERVGVERRLERYVGEE
jgi:quercetin dioxygenase-like cupin family protein